MDVTCEHCEAEYEFDETLLSDKGTTVKCSACGHVFRVMPPKQEGGRPPLKLRRARDGSEIELGSVRELQQRIRDGVASLDDQIGREGAPFRRLSEVPELKNFFAAASSEVPLPEAVPSADKRARHEPTAEQSGSAPPKSQAARSTLLGGAGATPFGDEQPTAIAPLAAQARALEDADEQPTLPPPAMRAPPVEARAAEPEDKAAKRTIQGVGPLEPPRPRPPERPAAAPRSGLTPLGMPLAHAVEQGRAPVARDPAPRAGRPQPVREEPAATPAGPSRSPSGEISAAGSVTPTLLGTPRAELEPGRRPPAPEPTAPARSDRAAEPATSPVEPRRAPPSAPAPKPAAAVAAWSAQPAPAKGALAAGSSAPPASAAPPAPVRLYLSEDEPPPARAVGSSSRLWLVALLLSIGVGGWIGVHTLTAPGAGESATVGQLAPAAAVPAAPPVPAAPAVPPSTGASAPPAAPRPEQAGRSEPAAPKAPAGAQKDESEPSAKAEARKPEKPEPAPKAASKPEPPREREREREPESYGELITHGHQLSARGDQAGASKAFRAALSLRPTGSEANSGLGFALLKAGQASEALPLFDRAASNGFADANIGLGDAYRKLGQPSSALEAYRAYLEVQPEGPRAAYARGWVEKLAQGGSKPAAEAEETPTPPEREPAPASEGYRPAGELIAPSEPATAEPTQPTERAE